jgi:glucosamine--fructose-6-phosphate aminotransferase (isomerizing)
MNLNENKYTEFALIKEMLETGEILKNVRIDEIKKLAASLKNQKNFLTGEGSSRIFPAKKIIADAMRNQWKGSFTTEAATQALEYNLDTYNVFVASNSGKTKEGVRLIKSLREQKHNSICGVIANENTPIQNESDINYLLVCGEEKAVAATKSVVEQAIFYDILFRSMNDAPLPDLSKLGDLITKVLETTISKDITSELSKSPVVYWAGRNDGVAEELALKTNEITRKKSDFLEGTYAVHGIEEVMNPNECVIWVAPFKSEEEKFADVLSKGVGNKVFAIHHEQTSFDTILIPEYGEFTPYLQLACGWNVMVEIGIETSIQIDKPTRARKVGNEFIG